MNRTQMFKVFCALGDKEAPSDLSNGLLWPVKRGKSIAKPF